ncbi:aspartyl/glutamyl-tRNA amidotransferase subunit C [Candidatus Gracilibacteria bacterium]|nr:aspartyl/glutamyl-tRNA amidotransferase subunit C [Candidatus Gracilibacteria bacterium]
MSFTEQDLDNLSSLARINVTKDEKPKMLLDMQAILGYVSEINEISLSNSSVEEERIALGEKGVFNVVREDVITRETNSNTKTLLDEAPSVKDDYVKVEQVLK